MDEPQLNPIPIDAIVYSDEKGEPQWFMLREANGFEATSFTGKVFRVHSWGDGVFGWGQVAEIFLKWDGCCHLGLVEPELGSWAHVCGADDMERTLKMLRWAWVQAQDRIAKYSPDERLRGD